MTPSRLSRTPRLGLVVAAASAALLVPAGVHAQTAAAANTASSAPNQSPAVVEARTHFDRGSALFARNNFDAALAEFQRAYELLEGSPRRYTLLFDIGQCYERLFRYDAALDAYRRYLTEAPADAEDRGTVAGTVHVLEGLLATVHVESNAPNAEVWVDNHRAGVAPGDVLIPGGRHLIQVRAAGYLPAQREMQLTARARESIRIPLERLSQFRGVAPGWFFASAGVAVVSAAVGAGFGIRALTLRSAVDAQLADPGRRYDVTEADRTAIRTSANVADGLFAAAALFAVGAGVLIFVTDWHGRGESRPARASLVVAPSAGGAVVMGSF